MKLFVTDEVNSGFDIFALVFSLKVGVHIHVYFKTWYAKLTKYFMYGEKCCISSFNNFMENNYI